VGSVLNKKMEKGGVSPRRGEIKIHDGKAKVVSKREPMSEGDSRIRKKSKGKDRQKESRPLSRNEPRG